MSCESEYDQVADKVSGGVASKTGGKTLKQTISGNADNVLTGGKTKNAAAAFVNEQSKKLATEAKSAVKSTNL